ncbi:hypothetical protein [Rhizobium halophytocola]|uniref:Solute-binding protein family 3/N-terminal domain-containing protein n=1 Tax=Rhizobium halophytocola TaxID=735519 RepID=A0ABS4DX07_9HYPH|nr:hypothetical protein [Rhizobium halophytocola]MBP1850210.1 hypothetical protein [Rhizobium halophytocola]
MKRAAAVLLTLILSLVSASPNTPGRADTPKLIIGVRSDARPFAYKRLNDVSIDSDATRGPLSRRGYSGYMIRICDAVLAEMMIDPGISPPLTLEDIQIYNLSETHRYAQIESQRPGPPDERTDRPRLPEPGAARFLELGTHFDILCDPATMTSENRWAQVSPPLFLTGIAYLSLKNVPAPGNPCGTPDPKANKTGGKAQETARNSTGTRSESPALIGLVGETTAAREGIQALITANELPKYKDKLMAYIQKSRDSQTTETGMSLPCKPGEEMVRFYPSHQAAAYAFCVTKSFHYYLGDVEIIRSHVAAIPGCIIENGLTTYTNDRYAIFGRAMGTRDKNSPEATLACRAGTATAPTVDGSSPPAQRDAGLVQRKLLVARFFEILNQKVVFNPSILDKAYEDTFPNQPQSRKLQLFYWAVRGERTPDPVQAIGTDGTASPAK